MDRLRATCLVDPCRCALGEGRSAARPSFLSMVGRGSVQPLGFQFHGSRSARCFAGRRSASKWPWRCRRRYRILQTANSRGRVPRRAAHAQRQLSISRVDSAGESASGRAIKFDADAGIRCRTAYRAVIPSGCPGAEAGDDK